MPKQKETAGKREAKSRSIFRRILRPLSLLAIADALLLIMVLQAAGVLRQLNQNSFDIFKKQVDNRQSYLQSQMTGRWMQLDEIASGINRRTQALLDTGKLDLDKLDSSGAECAGLILDVVEDLIYELYAKQVSGIFVAFNTHDLQADIESGSFQEKTGIYIRDNDPLSVASEKYADLLLECAPVSVVQSLALSTDSGWEQRFKFGPDRPYESWLVGPYTVAVESGGKLDASDCGLWSLRSDSEGKQALSYSVPLILSDGRVYGVLGVELLSGYLTSQMPTAELGDRGVYGFLMTTENSAGTKISGGTLCAVNDKSASFRVGDRVELTESKYGGYTAVREGTGYSVSLTQLSLYSRNAPFEQQRWYVMGAVPTASLFAFTGQVKTTLIIAVLLMLVFGITGALIASWHIARPITALRRELETSWDKGIPQLSKTGISEVDDFAGEITSLSRDVVNSSRRFLSIMEMSSIDMGGYELDEGTGFLFVTGNFFQLFGLEDVATEGMTPAQFRQQMDRIGQFAAVEPVASGGSLYAIAGSGGTRYIHVQQTLVESRCIGVAEDVTDQILERKRIEHERDYDLLTGIHNRRSFYRSAEQLLKNPEQLGVALVVMIDLDNLKSVNDTYGHELGDRYIMTGARCIREHVPEQSLIARASGDEFNLLLYGFRDRREARAAVERLQQGFRESSILLPDGQVKPMGASGGFCFAGEDTWDLQELLKRADFAMYLIKHGRKGSFGEFDPGAYHASEVEHSKHRAFRRVLQEKLVRYVYQPIVDARTGEVHACEALLRVMDSEIPNTEEFLRIARKEDALGEIEHLTWNSALSGFRRLIETGVVAPGTRIFINSQVSRLLNPAEQAQLIGQFSDLRENTVMEIVETDDGSAQLSRLQDGSLELFAREFALDDFGSGYNSEKNLLELMPRYVKLDMALVRDVQKHADRQQLLSGLIAFAHERRMLVLAEGVETAQELTCLLTLGVDLLQGFLLARPAETPGEINREAVALIRNFTRHREAALP
ncbi:MAG: EAL domain-containing protein [Faecousia sp.]